MKIIGLRIEKYVGQVVSGHNCDFDYTDEVLEKHILCGIKSDGKKIEIALSQEDGECGSGWTTASWGNIEVNQVDKFNGYTYKPIKPLIIDDFDDNKDDIDNKVFSISYDGGDSYYPSGGYSVNMELFKETPRNKSERPVWVFKGESNLGKSFISSKLNELTTYETDSNEVLPNVITEDIVVLGNKYTYSLEEIKNRIFGEYELILVDFVAQKSF
jgi:hypothetical protein